MFFLLPGGGRPVGTLWVPFILISILIPFRAYTSFLCLHIHVTDTLQGKPEIQFSQIHDTGIGRRF